MSHASLEIASERWVLLNQVESTTVWSNNVEMPQTELHEVENEQSFKTVKREGEY